MIGDLLGLDEYPGPAVIKLLPCSTQLKFSLLIKAKMLKNKEFSCFQTFRCISC